MSPLDLFDAILGPINPISRGLGILSALWHMPHRRALREGDYTARAVGLVGGWGSTRFAIPIKGEHSLDQVAAILRRYHVPAYSYLHDHKRLYFSVPKRQGRWAEYILIRHGVELEGTRIDQANARNAANYSTPPTPWRRR